MATVTAPVAGFSGESVCGIVFADGVAETYNPAALQYFEAAGYDVAYEPEPEAEAEVAKPAPEPKAKG